MLFEYMLTMKLKYMMWISVYLTTNNKNVFNRFHKKFSIFNHIYQLRFVTKKKKNFLLVSFESSLSAQIPNI